MFILWDKIEKLKKSLDNCEAIKRLVQIQEEIKNDTELYEKVKNREPKVVENRRIIEYKRIENEVNFLILEMNKSLKEGLKEEM